MRIRANLALCAVIGAAIIFPGAPVAAQEPGPVDCPTVRPVSEVAPGDTGVGYTVSRGTTPEPFDVEVIDVLHDAIAPGLPLIIVEVDSPEIDRVGGIWAGMSGSPVYVDGELIGAVAYGFSLAPSKLGGVTPAAAMLDVPNRPTLPPALEAAGPRSIRTSAAVRQLAVREHGMSSAAASAMRPLEVPVRLAGPTGDKFDQAAAAFERAHPGTTVVRGSGAGAASGAATTIQAGGNFAVSLAYGDFSAVGVGTATTVCGGVATAFGHPMLYEGATRLGMHGASAVRVVDDATFGPYKLANASGPVGTIDQDRLAAVAGRVGSLPVTTAVTSTITNTDDGRTVTGRTDLVLERAQLDAVLLHGWANYDTKVFDDYLFSGTSEVAWTIRGVRSGGRSFELHREDRHASQFDLSTASLIDAAVTAQVLHDNPFEQVRITEIDYQATAGSPYVSDRIVSSGLRVSVDGGPFERVAWSLTVVPGTELVVRVPLQRFRGSTRTIDVPITVPDDVSGFGWIQVAGGGSGDEDPFECLFDPEACAGDSDAGGLDAFIEQAEQRPRADDLVITLELFPDGEEPPVEDGEDDGDGTHTLAQVRVPAGEVVTGSAEVQLEVLPTFTEGVCPDDVELPFVDVDPNSVHAGNVACAAGHGITEGVSLTPPRFAPERTVTRGQVATFLARTLDVLGVDLPTPGSRFSDLDGSVHGANVERLAAAGIVRGRTATTYAPSDPVTRAQLASLLVGTVEHAIGGELEPSEPAPFPDVSGVHADNIALAWEMGLVRGRNDGTFGPNGVTRRDQAATVLVRLLEALWQD